MRKGDPTRARYPDEEGYIERDGVRVFYEVHGDGSPTLLLVPCTIVGDVRAWKAQIPYLARHFRVVAFDPRGRRRSDRPQGPEAYTAEQHVLDVLAVMTATDTAQALLVSHCIGSRPALQLLTRHPGRFVGAIFISPYLPLTRWPPVEAMWRTFETRSRARRGLEVLRALAKTAPLMLRSRSLRLMTRRVKWFEGIRNFNAHYILREQPGFLDWNARVLELTEPHSTRQIEDAVAWGLETDARTHVDHVLGLDVHDHSFQDRAALRQVCSQVRCPVLVIHGEDNLACPAEWGSELAEVTDGQLVAMEGIGHAPQGRKPVAVNLALREFVESVATTTPRTGATAAK